MGVWFIVVFNFLCFGFLKDVKIKCIFIGVIFGIFYYGNCFGVFIVGGEIYFDYVYIGNFLVNVMVLGLMEIFEIVKFGVFGIGNLVLYVGFIIGRDGMGGVSFVSVELSV